MCALSVVLLKPLFGLPWYALTKSQSVKAIIVNYLHPPHVLIPPTPAETARPARLPGARGGHPGEGAHCLSEGGDPRSRPGTYLINCHYFISSRDLVQDPEAPWSPSGRVQAAAGRLLGQERGQVHTP